MDQRERKEKLEVLASFDDIYAEVLYYRCMGKTVSDIAEILEIDNEGTIWARLTKIYSDLGIEGDNKADQLKSGFCHIFLDFVRSADDLKNWGHIRAEMRRQARAELSTKPPLPPPQPRRAPRRRIRTNIPWIVFALSFIVLCALGVFLSRNAWDFIGPIIENVPPFARVTQPPIVLQVPSRTPVLATEEVSFAPTQLAMDTQADSSQPISTKAGVVAVPSSSTPIHTKTPSPTNTPQSSPTPTIPPLFSDSFDTRLKDEWELAYGEYQIANGALTTGVDTLLLVGDENWENYTVEIISTRPTGSCASNAIYAYIAVRVQDAGNLIAFSYNKCESIWYVVKDNIWEVRGASEKPLIQGDPLLRVKVTADGDFFEAFVNGQSQGSIVVEDEFPQGKTGVKLWRNMIVDDFKVVPYP